MGDHAMKLMLQLNKEQQDDCIVRLRLRTLNWYTADHPPPILVEAQETVAPDTQTARFSAVQKWMQ